MLNENEDFEEYGKLLVYNNPEDLSSNVLHVINRGYPVTLTPEVINKILKDSDGVNVRKINRKNVELWKYRIKTDSIEPRRAVEFNIYGLLSDGQHLFEAAKELNRSIVVLVKVGLTSKAVSKIDTGGFQRPFGLINKTLGCEWTKADGSLASWLNYGIGTKSKLSDEERRDLCDKFGLVLKYINSNLKSGVNMPTKLAVANTYILLKDDLKINRLTEFCRVFTSGNISGGSKDQAAITLKSEFDTGKFDLSSHKNRPKVYNEAICAIYMFLEENSSNKIECVEFAKPYLLK
jgi:hypothetical protein